MNKELDKILLDEIPYIKECGNKFINKEMSKMEFKGISGRFGVYAHRDGKEFMIRLRTSCGVISKKQLHIIYNLASKYKLDKIHLTTRQAVQLHGLSIDNICNIMKEALLEGIYTRGGGGDFPRNVALSPLSGVNENEVFDVTPYAIACDKYFLKKIYTYKLPRKLKVSFSNNNNDSAHCTVQDLGFVATKENNKNYFKVFFGGGLGRNPAVSIEFPELIDPKDVLYHIEAITQLFIHEGNYENKSKARVRYITEKLGKDGFISEYKKYLSELKAKGDLDLHIEEINYEKQGVNLDLTHKRLFKQKQEGLYSVYIKPIGGILYLKDLKKVLDFIDNVSNVMIRSTMEEGFYILNLNGNEAREFLRITENLGGETSLEQSVCCIGVPICQMGVLESQTELNKIINYFKEKNFKKDVLPSIHISGCPNSCGAHEIAGIGLVGKKKRVDGELLDIFELHLGGHFNIPGTSLAKVYGDIPTNKIPELLYKFALEVDKSNLDFSTWLKNNEDLAKEIISKYAV